jgi:hypothetical protein
LLHFDWGRFRKKHANIDTSAFSRSDGLDLSERVYDDTGHSLKRFGKLPFF